ncbi:uncharacterized protein LOC126558314 [Anopheles maculipalpis]|uniref:uncharacterized protein LOC126558314 n=1 Tax=Anopheles maculipalpis TaxID=1496333 RepID=UPI002158D9E2|nr:uncharacterized protein LOC126558314 [Anopheles maculipalpis]
MRTLILVLSVAFVAAIPAKDCVINVRESMVKLLSNSKRSGMPCKLMWDNLLLRVRNTHDSLSACQQREFTTSPTKPSTVDCQRELEKAKLEIQGDHNYYTATMMNKMQLNEWDTAKHKREIAALENQIQTTSQEFKSMYRNLIFLNIHAGSIKQALRYYHRFLQGNRPGQLLTDLVAWMYQDPAQEQERLIQLLEFTRKLPSATVKLSLYQQIDTEMKKHQKQHASYLAMILALDVGRIAFRATNDPDARRLYLDIFQPAMAYLKRTVMSGNYDELVTFATTHPSHFEEVENRISTMDESVWNNADFDRFVTYPNRLPLAKQRLEAFRMLVLQINQRNKSNFADRLVKVARELEQCETFIRTGKNDPVDLDKLRTVKALFSKLQPKHEYDHYLALAKEQ